MKKVIMSLALGCAGLLVAFSADQAKASPIAVGAFNHGAASDLNLPVTKVHRRKRPHRHHRRGYRWVPPVYVPGYYVRVPGRLYAHPYRRRNRQGTFYRGGRHYNCPQCLTY